MQGTVSHLLTQWKYLLGKSTVSLKPKLETDGVADGGASGADGGKAKSDREKAKQAAKDKATGKKPGAGAGAARAAGGDSNGNDREDEQLKQANMFTSSVHIDERGLQMMNELD